MIGAIISTVSGREISGGGKSIAGHINVSRIIQSQAKAAIVTCTAEISGSRQGT